MFLLISESVFPQADTVPGVIKSKTHDIYGFCRAGFYGWKGSSFYEPDISSGYIDMDIKYEKVPGTWYSIFADLRYRYGYEFSKPVSRFEIREARFMISRKKWNATFGQQVIKWGRTDIINPESKLNPFDLLVRSSDREDMDLGNLSARLRYYPSQLLSFEAVVTPFYRPSVMMTDLIPLPSYVNLKGLSGLRTDRVRLTYAIRSDLHLSSMDIGLSWFDGYDPMPGTRLRNIAIDNSGPVPLPVVDLTFNPYKISNACIDFEATAGETIIRGEAIISTPHRSYKKYEYVPMPEINWVAGADRFVGDWHVLAEYSVKMIPDFTRPAVVPLFTTPGTMDTFDLSLFSDGFDTEYFMKEQVASFNRLYLYQLHKWYHSAGLRISRELFYGKMSSSLLVLYNFTSYDLYLNPCISVSPVDGLTIKVSLDYFSGKNGSLYDLTDSFLNSINAAIRIDF